jgi:uncharacterized protein (DUF4415 family)
MGGFPPLTEQLLGAAAREVFPTSTSQARPVAQKTPTKLQATIRFDRDVISISVELGRGGRRG